MNRKGWLHVSQHAPHPFRCDVFSSAPALLHHNLQLVPQLSHPQRQRHHSRERASDERTQRERGKKRERGTEIRGGGGGR